MPTPAAAPKSSTAPAAHTGASTLNRTAVVVDAAHGGTDSGARIDGRLLEKDVTLQLALRLRSLLNARGFTVTMTRDTDTSIEAGTANTQLTLDERAGIANHARAAACLLLHATNRGNGVHLYTSQLTPTAGEPPVTPWLTAQAAWVPMSVALERSISTALGRSHLALLSSTASVRPMDSLNCPALIVELAPEDGNVSSITSAGYQDRVAAAIAGALLFWQNQAQAPARLTTPGTEVHPAPHRRAVPKPAPEEPATP